MLPDEGEPQLSTVLAYSVDALGSPYVGVVLGLAVAAGLLFASRASMRMVRGDDGGLGLVLASISLFARLAVATISLWAYRYVAPTGFKPFALALAGGFVLLYTLEIVRYAGLHKRRRPAAVR